MHRVVLALVLATLSLSLPSPSFAQDAKEEAKERFEKGVSRFKENDFEAALVEFRAAYKAKPHFAVRYNVGICLYKLHRYSEAAKELRAYLHEGGKKVPKDQKKEVEQILKELESLVGELNVISNVDGAEILVDDEYKDKTPLMFPIPLDVGEHDVELRAAGYASAVEKVEVPGGAVVDVEMLLEAAQQPGVSKKLKPIYFWSTLGTTGAFALIAIITGSVALKREDEYAGLEYEDNWKPFKEATRRLTVATDVFWGLAGAAAIATIVLAIKTDFKTEKAEEELALTPSIEPFGVQVRWGF